jgi:polyamine oxidase
MLWKTFLATLMLAHAMPPLDENPKAGHRHKVVILGGGVAGITAARELYRAGIDDFIIIEARDELGGRLRSTHLGNLTLELGANWIEGLRSGQSLIITTVH